MSIFEKAVRMKLRFDSPVGNVTAEDLYDLPLTSTVGKANLDDIAKEVHRRIQELGNIVSFVEPGKPVDETDQLRLEILKHVITTRLAERAAAAKAAESRERKQQIMAIIAKKQDAALEASSLEDLQKLLAGL